MRVSEHFTQALFHDQNSATDAFFDERASKLFQLDNAGSFLEFAFQIPPPDTSVSVSPGRVAHREEVPDLPSNLPSESIPQTHNDHLYTQPPNPGPFKIERRKVTAVADLNQIAHVGFCSLINPT